VGVAYEDGVFTVGFEDEDGSGALLFSQSDTIDAQDSILGMDTYSISTQDGATVYGGVESATLSGTNMELQTDGGGCSCPWPVEQARVAHSQFSRGGVGSGWITSHRHRHDRLLAETLSTVRVRGNHA
jgi:hypothetical protein